MNILDRFTVTGRRRRLADAAPQGVLKELLGAPPTAPDSPLTDLSLLAVDMETTGLDAEQDQLLAIGWVPVDGRRIDLAGAGSVLVRSTAPVGDSATVHGLTDDRLADGLWLSEALPALLRALHGRVLLAHFSQIEEDFLDQACRTVYQASCRVEAVDTLQLQRRILGRGYDDLKRGSLRLWEARRRYGLPRYRAHDALTDALACAELYLAQTEEMSHGRRRPLTLRDLQR